MTPPDPVAALFANKAATVRETYDAVLRAVTQFGPFTVEPKKTSLHLVNGTGFAGVHPRTKWLDLTLRTEGALTGPRIRAQEQVSRNRWHQDVRLFSPADIDDDVRAWLRQAYKLTR